MNLTSLSIIQIYQCISIHVVFVLQLIAVESISYSIIGSLIIHKYIDKPTLVLIPTFLLWSELKMFNRNPKHWKMQHIPPDINEHLKNNNTDHCLLDSINNTTSTIMSRPSNWTTWQSSHLSTTVEQATSGGVPDDANSTMTNAATTLLNIHCNINRKSVKRKPLQLFVRS